MREAYQEANQNAAEVSYKGSPGNDNGRQDQRGKRGEVHGDVSKSKDAKTSGPAHRKNCHPPDHNSYTRSAFDNAGFKLFLHA